MRRYPLPAVAVFLVVALALAVRTARAETITYDMLDAAQLEKLGALEQRYLNAVRDDALGLLTASFDTHTILTTLTPQVRIIRQRKRQLLHDVIRYLSSLRLEVEFINAYANRLRDDALDYALDALIRKAGGMRLSR